MHIDEEYFNNEDFRENLKAYEDSVKSGHSIFMDADDLTDIIDYYNMMHMDDEAEQAANYALSLFPGASGPITFKVRKYIDANQLDKADALAETVSDKEIDYKYVKAEIQLARNNPEEADILFDEVMDVAEEDEMDNCILDAANIFFDYNFFEYANKWLNKVEDRGTDDFLELKVRTLSALGEIEKVEKMLNRLIDNNPFEHKYWNLMSNAQLANDKTAEALSSSEYSLAVTPDNPGGLLAKAQVLVRTFQYEEAIKFFEAYLRYFPSDVNSYIQIGYCFMNLSDNTNAILAYRKAEKYAGKAQDALSGIYENIALAYSHTGNSQMALEYIDKLSKLDNHPDKDHAELLRCYVYLETGRLKDGITSLAAILEATGYSSVYVLKVSVVLYENHLIEAAYILMRDNYPLDDPTTVFGYSYIALYCFDLGKDEEFLKYLKIAVERNPEEVEMALHTLFPEGMKPSEYYDYFKKNIKK